MKYTSAAASKLIRTLEDRKQYLLQKETNDSTYVLAEDEKEDTKSENSSSDTDSSEKSSSSKKTSSRSRKKTK